MRIDKKRQIGKRLKSIRTMQQYPANTQMGFARILGVPYRTYQDWELGKSKPKYEMVIKIGNLLGYNPAWIYFGEGQARRPIGERKIIPLRKAENDS